MGRPLCVWERGRYNKSISIILYWNGKHSSWFSCVSFWLKMNSWPLLTTFLALPSTPSSISNTMWALFCLINFDNPLPSYFPFPSFYLSVLCELLSNYVYINFPSLLLPMKREKEEQEEEEELRKKIIIRIKRITSVLSIYIIFSLNQLSWVSVLNSFQFYARKYL